MFIRYSIFLIMFLLALATPATAQGLLRPADMQSVDLGDFPSMLSPDDVKFMILAPSELSEDLYILHGGTHKRVQVRPQALSAEHFYSGASPMKFFRQGKDEEGKVIYTPIAELELPSGTKDLIVCLQRRGEQYTAFPVDLSLSAQPLGTVKFVNFTPANLIVLLDKEKSMLEPGANLLSRFETKEKTYFNFKIGAMYENEPKMLFSNRYPFRGEMRLLFIGFAAGAGSPGESPFRVVSHRDRGPVSRALVAE